MKLLILLVVASLALPAVVDALLDYEFQPADAFFEVVNGGRLKPRPPPPYKLNARILATKKTSAKVTATSPPPPPKLKSPPPPPPKLKSPPPPPPKLKSPPPPPPKAKSPPPPPILVKSPPPPPPAPKSPPPPPPALSPPPPSSPPPPPSSPPPPPSSPPPPPSSPPPPPSSPPPPPSSPPPPPSSPPPPPSSPPPPPSSPPPPPSSPPPPPSSPPPPPSSPPPPPSSPPPPPSSPPPPPSSPPPPPSSPPPPPSSPPPPPSSPPPPPSSPPPPPSSPPPPPSSPPPPPSSPPPPPSSPPPPPASPPPPPASPPPPPPSPPPSGPNRNISRWDKYYMNNWTPKDPAGGLVLSDDEFHIDMKITSPSQIFGHFLTQNRFVFGYFYIYMKLIPNDSAGIIMTYYFSSPENHTIVNGSDTDTHDEMDFEFLGNVSGQPITLQTNLYLNGKGGREQRHYLPFDPSADFHKYSLLWNQNLIIWYVDDSVIRVHYNKQGVPYPTYRPMAAVASLWNGSSWATQGGKIKLNISDVPFVMQVEGLDGVDGCVFCPTNIFTDPSPNCTMAPNNPALANCSSGHWWNTQTALSSDQEAQLQAHSENYIIYNYCYNYKIASDPPPECQYNEPS